MKYLTLISIPLMIFYAYSAHMDHNTIETVLAGLAVIVYVVASWKLWVPTKDWKVLD
jgi:hypothetical protein